MRTWLERIPLLSGLETEHFRKLDVPVHRRLYPKNTVIFYEGEPREAVFFVLGGLVKTTKADPAGKEQTISLLQSGEMFPHIGLFDDAPYPATAKTILDTELAIVAIDAFRRLLTRHPETAALVIGHMERKIQELQHRLQNMSSDVQRRFIALLLKLADEFGNEDNGRIVLPIPLTHQEWASLLGTTRETINRIVNQLKKERLLSTDKRYIILFHRDRLHEIMQADGRRNYNDNLSHSEKK